MKQLQRSELPPALAAQLANSRFVLFDPKMFGGPDLIAHGNDPVAVSRGNQAVVLDEQGSPKPPHVNKPSTGETILNRGTLYRID